MTRHLEHFYTLPIMIVSLFFISGCFNVTNPQNEFVQTAELDRTSHPHSTTRQFQRMVFFANNQWAIFYSDGADCLYKVSKDGISWSKPKIMDKGIAGSSHMDVIYRDHSFYYFNSLDINPSPNKRKVVLHAQKGVVKDEKIDWEKKYRIFTDDDSAYNFVYSSVSMDVDGYLWAASRHWSPLENIHDVIVSKTLQPYNITSWTPGESSLKNTDQESLAPQIIGVGSGKAFLIAKATKKGKIFGNFYDGAKWLEKDSLVGYSSKVAGDDKRMSMVFEPGGKSTKDRIHLVYIDNKDHLRYRVFLAPYREQNWNPQLDQPGDLIVKDSKGRPTNTFSCILSIDRSKEPAWIYLLYGETKFRGKDSREIMGEFRLIRYAEGNWSNQSLLMSESRTKHNWYPNMNENVDKKIGILYMKNLKSPWEIMFSSADKTEIDESFDKPQG